MKFIKKIIKTLTTIILCFLLLIIPVYAETLKEYKATVYSIEGKTSTGTNTRYGICASGDKDLLNKYIIIFQQKPDNAKGDCLGIFHVEDSGCNSDTIDIWCPPSLQKSIINKTYENGCKGQIYVKIVE